MEACRPASLGADGLRARGNKMTIARKLLGGFGELILIFVVTGLIIAALGRRHHRRKEPARRLLKGFGATRDEADQTPPAPTTLAYTSYLLRMATLGDYSEVLQRVGLLLTDPSSGVHHPRSEELLGKP